MYIIVCREEHGLISYQSLLYFFFPFIFRKIIVAKLSHIYIYIYIRETPLKEDENVLTDYLPARQNVHLRLPTV